MSTKPSECIDVTHHQIVKALNNHIGKIEKWLDSYREGTNPELDRKPPMMNVDIWDDLEEQRYEYLEGLHSKLCFIRDYPDREMTI